jgi:hypothetical protein
MSWDEFWSPEHRRGMMARLCGRMRPEPPSSRPVLEAIDRVRGLEARLSRIESTRALRRLEVETGAARLGRQGEH